MGARYSAVRNGSCCFLLVGGTSIGLVAGAFIQRYLRWHLNFLGSNDPWRRADCPLLLGARNTLNDPDGDTR